MWIFHSRKNKTKIIKVHERCLRLINSGKILSFEELLEKDELVSNNCRIFRYLQRKYAKSKMINHPKFSVIYFVKQK